MSKTAEELLRVDEERAVAALEAHVRGLCARMSAKGVIAGLSGGLDSTVLLSVAVRAIGPDPVHALYLPESDPPHDAEANVRLTADRLGIELESVVLGPERDRPPRTLLLSAALNRFLHRTYRVLAGETPFVSSLRAGAGDARDRTLRDMARRRVELLTGQLFERAHRRRRLILETAAEARGLLPLGGANRSEWETGWFVKDGIDDLPHQPLIGLYKTQVRQIARYLGVPDEVLGRAPSPDMMKGIDDEFAIGMSYGTIDLALDHLAGGVSDEQLGLAGVTRDDVRSVRELRELSRWKRREPAGAPPVDGGPDGGLRRGE